VQTRRKALDLEFTDRIDLTFATPSPELRAALETHVDYVAAETLATQATVTADAIAGEAIDIDGHELIMVVEAVAHG
jgi:hypothetical protein